MTALNIEEQHKESWPEKHMRGAAYFMIHCVYNSYIRTVPMPAKRPHASHVIVCKQSCNRCGCQCHQQQSRQEHTQGSRGPMKWQILLCERSQAYVCICKRNKRAWATGRTHKHASKRARAPAHAHVLTRSHFYTDAITQILTCI